jgi:hypothetical protein
MCSSAAPTRVTEQQEGAGAPRGAATLRADTRRRPDGIRALRRLCTLEARRTLSTPRRLGSEGLNLEGAVSPVRKGEKGGRQRERGCGIPPTSGTPPHDPITVHLSLGRDQRKRKSAQRSVPEALQAGGRGFESHRLHSSPPLRR